MTSCGGTFSVTVRRSTLTIRSTIGMIRKMPGPFGSGRSRPRRKMTPRSYSRVILTARKRSRTRIATTTAKSDQGDAHAVCSSSVGCAVDPTTSRKPSSTSSTRTCSPGTSGEPSAVRARQSSPLTKTSAVAPHDAFVADEVRRADSRRQAAHADDLRDREAEEDGEGARDREGDRQRHLVGVAGRIEEHERAEDERAPRRRASARRESGRTPPRRRSRRRGASGAHPASETGSTWSP